MRENIHRPFLDTTPENVKTFINSVPQYAQEDDPTFWPENKLHQVRIERLQRQVGWLAEASPFYREKFKEWGIRQQDIQTFEDLQKVPPTTKADLMADPQKFRLQFEKPTIYDQTYSIVYTTGTTSGVPTRYEYTSHDFLGILEAGRRIYKMQYALPGDRVFNVFPLSPLPHVAMFAGSLANAAGISYTTGMTGPAYPDFPIHRSTESVLDQIEIARPQILVGITSFVRRLLQQAVQEGRDLSFLYMLQISGESTTQGMRQKIQESMRACGADHVFISSSYGFTEGGIGWGPCNPDSNLHNIAPDQMYLEILDADTYERVPDGEEGLVAITHLNRRGMPLLRYLLGDLSSISHERCPYCGRIGESIRLSCGSAHVTRTSDLFKVKGVLVNPECIHDVIMNYPEVLEYRIVLENSQPGDPHSGDELILTVAVDPEYHLQEEQLEHWISDVKERVFNSAEIHPDVEIVSDSSTIYDPEKNFKATRVIDNRVQSE